MSQRTKRQIIEKTRDRYNRAGRKYKATILSELQALIGYERKYTIKLLRGKRGCRYNNPGRKKQYREEVANLLKDIWQSTGQMCSKRLAVAMSEWLPYYEKLNGKVREELRLELLSISPAQIDRLLKPYRINTDNWRHKGPRPGTVIRSKIPLRTGPWEEERPGFMEADTVAHCGGSMAGSFVWSITYTDIASNWTCLRGVWNRGQDGVVEQTRNMENTLPFDLLGFDCDNGGEFLNSHMYYYLMGRHRKIDFTRSRPYHKNDNAHVEQKNWTHVRQLMGYDRLEHPKLVVMLNDLYKNAWEPLHNYFNPSSKLISKERIGSRYKKKYDKPKTPYQRLMESEHLSGIQKKRLRDGKEKLNPFELRRLVEQKLNGIYNFINEYEKTTLTEESFTDHNDLIKNEKMYDKIAIL